MDLLSHTGKGPLEKGGLPMMPKWRIPRPTAFVGCIINAGILLIITIPCHADISYCGPVSYKYTRHLKWQMDYTDKQGNNHKQVKEEKKIFDSEWYICLGGNMTGNTGVFDGEKMQADFSFTATEDWLDQITHSSGRAGRKENNQSLPEGQQGGMRGTLSLDCPEGYKVPGKKCAYDLNLFFSTAYVYQTNQETFTSGDQPPEVFTLPVTQLFARQITLEERPLVDAWSVEGDLIRDIKAEENADDCESILRRPHVKSCSYEEKETVNWSLDRKGSDCGGRITRVKGDVTINGRSVSQGNISLAKGDVIQTGKHSRLEIKLNDHSVIRLGSNNKLEIDPCFLFSPEGTKGLGLRLYGGKLRAIVQEIVGAKYDFRIQTGTAVAGVRGEIPKTHMEVRGLLADLLSGVKPVMAATLPEDIPTLGTRVADLIFSVETIPEEKVTVEVFKGHVLIKDNRGSRQLLVKQGDTVSSWADGGPFEDVTITNAPD